MNKSYKKEVEIIKDYLSTLGIPFEYKNHFIIINKRFFFVPRTSRWRVVKKNTWYYSLGIESFIEKYYMKDYRIAKVG